MSVSIQRKQVWLFFMLILFSVAFNSDWKDSSIIWWGSVAFFAAAYAFYRNWKISLKFTKADCWLLGLLALSAISVTYAANKAVVVDMLKTLLVMLATCYMIGNTIENENDVDQILFVIMLSILVVVLYLYTNFDLNLFVLTRVGLADTGLWNANEVGIISTVGIMIGLEQLKKGTVPRRLIIVAMMAAFTYIAIIMASRKAFVMLIVVLCGMRMLNQPQKLIRNMALITIGLCVAWYMILEIPFFYQLIGWRMEGMIAAIKGQVGTSDSSSFYRVMMVKSALETFKKHPILGVGMDNFRFFNANRVTYAHNNFAEIAADLGIVGIVGYYWIFVYIIIDFVKTFKKHDAVKNFLFVVIMAYLMNHIAMVTITDMLQCIFIYMYVSYSEKTKQEMKNSRKSILVDGLQAQ